MNARVPVEVFHPGEFLKEEIEARNWSQQELADILGRSPRLISEVISGKRAVTPETAKALSDAFGTSAEYWMNLESQYQLSKVRYTNDTVMRKARLYSKFPVRDMIKRGWVSGTESMTMLEQNFLKFFQIVDLNETPTMAHFARKRSYNEQASIIQLTWLFRVRQLAETQIIGKYSATKLQSALPRLHALMTAPEEVRHVPGIMAECGVRFVLVEALPGSEIDGVSFWLENGSPVIGLSMKFDRIDNFWFVLRHEIEHILKEHGGMGVYLDHDLDQARAGLPIEEEEANSAAQEFCVPIKELDSFCARVAPYFSEQRVLLFAQRIAIHPGIVVGQLHKRLGRHDFLRKHQVKVRPIIAPVSTTDGWGFLPQ